jgi:hypothetical protein
VNDGVALNEPVAGGRWCSVGEAATALGMPERAIYRQIATHGLRARRDAQGALQVCLDGESTAAPPGAFPTIPTSPPRETGLSPERARALTEFATGLVEPLVGRLGQQDQVIREQAEELGRLRAKLELLGEGGEHLAPHFARQLAELAAIREEIEGISRKRRWWPFG